MMAQAPTATPTPNKVQASAKLQHAADAALNRNAGGNSTASIIHLRESHTDASIELIDPGNAGGSFTLFINSVFQDSTVQAVYSNGTFNVTTQKAGGIFDPKSTAHFGTNALTNFDPYTVDTVWIGGEYTMTSTPTTGDTLCVEIIYGPPTAAWWQGLVITAQSESFRMPDNTTSLSSGNTSFSLAPGTNKVVVKRVLTALDTFTDPNVNPDYPYIAVVPTLPISIPAGNIIGIEYTFIPSTPYAAGDIYFSSTGTATMNSFLGLIYEDANAGNGDNFFYDASSWGISGDLNNTSRYGLWPTAQNFLNGSMLPYTEDGYLNDVSITATSVGIHEASATGVELGQNIPNPSNGTTVINYSLVDNATVTMNVYDVAGKLVMSVDKGQQSAGKYRIDLNTSNLDAGVYFYTLNADGKQATRKMIVQ